MNYIFLTSYFLVLILYFYLIIQLINQLNKVFKSKTVSQKDVKTFIKKIGLINLFLPYIIVSLAMSSYPNVYLGESGSVPLPPITTIYSLSSFIIFLILFSVLIKKVKSLNLFTVDDFSYLLYNVIFFVIIVGTTILLTTLVSFFERLTYGLY